MRTIKKSIEINASKEKIWDVLTQDPYNQKWYSIFSPGTYALTDWQLGSKVVFADNSGSGIIGRIIIHDPYELLSIEYYGVLNDNKEDFDSTEAQIFKGAHETYRLTSKDEKVVLDIESDMSDGFFDTMSASWDKALIKIRELSES
ncbi:SRPBCC domain-containing protein [Emticicia sp. BO119]|uniref:SRPBCC domain-containing protein n=1 Tax=Emticicia sp. BO119 TaxID=2757768 RepID=UPI0015F0A29C|nr:SRPBCC domain-containing protein [Emticicia sp. BO119]MBA4853078.1 SRPBCC domain-containing protein [Emticicia sp. BO119]